jgi:predicted esterase
MCPQKGLAGVASSTRNYRSTFMVVLTIQNLILHNNYLLWEEKIIIKFFMKRQYSIFVMLSMLILSLECSAKDAEIIMTDTETIKTYCSPADNLNWVIGKDECLKIITLNKGESVSPDTLVVYLHGDGARGGRPSDYLKRGASRINKNNVAHIILMRPGYYDSTRHSSTGISHRKSRRGTNYNSHNVEEIALAIKKLKDYHKSNKVIIVGHSGGAAIAALILGRHPEIANGAILAACPCNVDKWVQMVGKNSGKGALSPHNYVENIGPKVTIIALTGTEDKNTFPVLAVEYIEKLKKNNVNATFIGVEGETHNGVTRSRQFYDAINQILQ